MTMKQTIVTGASAASFSQADWLSPRASTDLASATPRSRSATQCRTAVLGRFNAPSVAEKAYPND
jgi:hypothetical protein